MAEAYLSFWGKAGGARDGQPGWHPLPYHCLDVAAVADALLTSNPRKLRAIARLMEATPDQARNILVALISLHDIGKFAETFQAKCESAWPRDALGDYRRPRGTGRHDALASEIRDILGLRSVFGPAFRYWSASDFDHLWHAVSGHHGSPQYEDPSKICGELPARCEQAAAAFCREIATLFAADIALPRPPVRSIAMLSWLVAGLTVISDWIGSNRVWFPYMPPALSLADYWAHARIAAQRAILRAGILPVSPHEVVSPGRFLPAHVADALSPLQQAAWDHPFSEGPVLAIVEDVTGSGKTEAAVLMAARLISERRADGLFFALPTMATANAMYDRLYQTYGKLFADGTCPSLVLAHGKRKLHQGFSCSILEDEDAKDDPDRSYEESAQAVCAAWIGDDRRKAFLAHIGVGTIDQAVLGVLPSRYQALRLWGLADRVLIIDEAHAYDPYLNREIEALLEFHSALGGSAIILSATLPAKQRAGLISAFAKGRGQRVKIDTAGGAYPLLTVASEEGVSAQPLPSRADRTRALPVRRIASTAEALDYVVAMAAKGAAVAWIRNSVDDALDAADLLKAQGITPCVLHARFAMGDRLAIEARVATTLGRQGEDTARRGFVVVGTQILEQSLDYDVDVMITDLAPIDLLIQRAGRLWRHARGTRPVVSPELVVLSPDPATVQDKDWYHALLPRAATVYDHHGIVWRSAKVLFETGCIATPNGVRDLIERVYAPEELEDIPAPLLAKSQDAIGRSHAATGTARSNVLKVEKGYAGEPLLWTSDTITPTRLGEPVMVFRLGKIENGRLVPWCRADDDDPARSWALSEISVRKALADGVPSGVHTDVIAAAKAHWPEWERDKTPLLVLEPGNECWSGKIDKGDEHRSVRYDPYAGLRFS